MASETNVQPENFIRNRVRIDHLGPSPVTLERNNTDEQVINTTTETDLLSYSVPGGTLVGDHGLRVTMDGFVLDDSGGSADLDLRIKLGGTTLHTVAYSSSDVGAATEFPWNLQFELVAKNSDAIQELFGVFSNTGGRFYAESTEDATGGLVLAVTAEFSAADAAREVTLRRYLIELL